jgi:hypothetical protein
MIKPAWKGGIVTDFKLDKDIHFDFRLGTKEEPEIVLARNIRFFVEEGQLLGTLRSSIISNQKFKWCTSIDIVDGMGNSIASTEQVRETGGIDDPDYYRWFEHNIHFSLGSWNNVLQGQAKKISVRCKKVSDDIAPTLDAWIESNILEVVHGQVTDADGKPIANAMVQIREKRKKGQKGIAAPGVRTDEQGFYSFDEIRWPYHIGVVIYDEDPAGQGYRHQYKRWNNKSLHGTQNIDFKFEEFPQGTAVLAGQIVKPDGSAVTEFTVNVRNKVDWKDYSGQYLHQFGIIKPFVSSDGKFEISELPQGMFGVGINLTGKEFKGLEHNLKYIRKVCELIDGKTTEVTIETAVKKAVKATLDGRVQYYGRVLYENGKPAVPPTCPWKGAKVYVILRYTDATSTHGGLTEKLGDVDKQGYFTAYLSDEQLENIKNGKYKIEIYHPSYENEAHTHGIGTFPAEMLTQDRNTSKGYRLPHENMSARDNLEQILKSYDMLHELGFVLLDWSDKHNGRFPESLNDLVSLADTETLTWIVENLEYQAGRRTEFKAEIFPVAYDKTLLEKINGTHVLFSNGGVEFLQKRKLEIISNY